MFLNIDNMFCFLSLLLFCKFISLFIYRDVQIKQSRQHISTQRIFKINFLENKVSHEEKLFCNFDLYLHEETFFDCSIVTISFSIYRKRSFALNLFEFELTISIKSESRFDSFPESLILSKTTGKILKI